jgi:hypothetical protein
MPEKVKLCILETRQGERERESALVLYRRLSSPVAVGKKKKMTLADPPSLLNFNGLETIG